MTPRIACLVPSVTELLAALGLGPFMVARTGFCIRPADLVSAIPKVGGTKDVNLPKLQRLAPTHVVVNVDENRLETVQALRQFVPSVLVTHPCDPQDNPALVAQMVGAFGALPGVRDRAVELTGRMVQALEQTLPEGRPARSVLYLIWREPWMTVARDTYLSRMLARVNWQTLPAVDGGPHGAARYPVLDGSEPWLGDVREVLLSSEPYAFGNAHAAEAQRLCPAANVRLVDGEALSWYGPRMVQGLRLLRDLAGNPVGN